MYIHFYTFSFLQSHSLFFCMSLASILIMWTRKDFFFCKFFFCKLQKVHSTLKGKRKNYLMEHCISVTILLYRKFIYFKFIVNEFKMSLGTEELVLFKYFNFFSGFCFWGWFLPPSYYPFLLIEVFQNKSWLPSHVWISHGFQWLCQ